MTMKKNVLFSVMMVMAVVAVSFVSFTGKAENVDSSSTESPAKVEIKGKVLVAYFTWPEPDGIDASSGASRIIADDKLYGNTEFVAHIISETTQGDLFAIKTEKSYPSPHKALIDDAKKEAENNERPKMTTRIENLKDYDVVFVGYPNWWYDMPMVIYSFFDAYDFKGKTIIPFVTHGGSRFSQSVQTIKELEKEARVIEGPSVSARNVPSAESSVIAWLEKQGFKK